MATDIRQKHAYDIINNCIGQLQIRKKHLADLLDEVDSEDSANLIGDEIIEINKVIKFLKK